MISSWKFGCGIKMELWKFFFLSSPPLPFLLFVHGLFFSKSFEFSVQFLQLSTEQSEHFIKAQKEQGEKSEFVSFHGFQHLILIKDVGKARENKLMEFLAKTKTKQDEWNSFKFHENSTRWGCERNDEIQITFMIQFEKINWFFMGQLATFDKTSQNEYVKFSIFEKKKLWRCWKSV